MTEFDRLNDIQCNENALKLYIHDAQQLITLGVKKEVIVVVAVT